MLEVQKNGVPAIIANYNNSKHIQMGAGSNGAGFHLTDGNFFTINHQPYADKGTDSNLTERLRITSAGDINIHNTTAAQTTDPITVDLGGQYTPNASITHANLKLKVYSNASNGDSQGLTASSTGLAYVSSVTTDHIFYTSPSSVNSLTERLRITSAGTLQIGSSATINVQITPNTGLVINDGAIDCYQATSNSAAIPFKIQSDVGGTKVVKASITAGGVISDSIGPLRRLGITGMSGDYTLVASDAGKQVRSDGAHVLTLPNNVFETGDMITVTAHSAGAITINQGSGMTLYNAADGSSGNVTLAARTVCTIFYAEGGSSSKAYIAGGGIS